MPVTSSVQQEWRGQTSEKFNTWKAHIEGPQPKQDGFHPFYNVEQKKHFQEVRSDEFKWVSSSKPVLEAHKERVDRPQGKGFPKTKFTETKDHFEKRHMQKQAAQTTLTYDNPKLTKVTFDHHNKVTVAESALECEMTQKKRLNTISDMRGGYPLSSLGDKNYKAVEYDPGFFLAGGLAVGSTNRMKQKNLGNGKAVDFYSGLKLDGPLNKGSKNYEQVTKEQNHMNEVTDVSELRKWERNILQEVDTKYDPDDDSSDEEAIRVRKDRAAKKAIKEQAEAEAKAAADPKNKKK